MSTNQEFFEALGRETNQLPQSPERLYLIDGLVQTFREMKYQTVRPADAMTSVNSYLTKYEGEIGPDAAAQHAEVIARIDNLMIEWKEKLEQASGQ